MLIATLCSALLIFPLIHCNYANITSSPKSSLDDLPAFVDREYPFNFTTGRKKCHKADTVFYNGTCYKFGERGPCKENEYFRHDKSIRSEEYIHPFCATKSFLYSEWYDELESGLAMEILPQPYDYKCHNVNNVLYEGKCYRIGKRGPCKRDEYLFSVHVRYLKTVCERKPFQRSHWYAGTTHLSSGLTSSKLSALIDHKYPFNFTQEEMKCHKVNKVLFNGKCYKIGKRGPCKTFEYLVYDKLRAQKGDGALKPICQRKPCPKHYQYVATEKKCYHNKDVLQYCPDSNDIKPKMNLYGEIYCQCSNGNARLFDSMRGECYRFYNSYLCGNGSLFLPVVDFINFGFGECAPSPCQKYHLQVRFDNGTKQCVPIQSSDGTCNDGKSLEFEYTDSFPRMFSLSCWAIEVTSYGGVEGAVSTQLVYSSQCVEKNRGDCTKIIKHTPLDPYNFYFD